MNSKPKVSLRRELLLNLGLLVAAALSLAVVTALVTASVEPPYALVALTGLIAADVAIVFLFGRYLLDRLVLQPVAALKEAAEAIAAGDLQRRAPPAVSRELDELASCFNRMTERLLDAQGQLVQSEKLATLGRIAAGIAHEIGNPLSAIGTYLEVLGKRNSVDPALIGAIQKEASRIDRIIQSLLDYARPRRAEPATVDLVAVVRSVYDLLQDQGVLKKTHCRMELDGPPLTVRAPAQALEQVVVNLLLNAVEAAPQGTVVVGARRSRLEASASAARGEDAWAKDGAYRGKERWLGLARGVAPGEYGALLYVADSGPGVPPEDREKIFEPFYTTKQATRGTGLGLAIVYRTVRELGGLVWVEDAREGGAAFKVFLPLVGETE